MVCFCFDVDGAQRERYGRENKVVPVYGCPPAHLHVYCTWVICILYCMLNL